MKGDIHTHSHETSPQCCSPDTLFIPEGQSHLLNGWNIAHNVSKVTSTSPLTCLISTNNPISSFAVVKLDGAVDWIVAQRDGLLAWTGQNLSVTPRADRHMVRVDQYVLWISLTLTPISVHRKCRHIQALRARPGGTCWQGTGLPYSSPGRRRIHCSSKEFGGLLLQYSSTTEAL